MTFNKRTRILVLVLTITLSMNVLPVMAMAAGSSAENPPRNEKSLAADAFTDVNKSDWFYDDVMFVYERGLMNGTASGKFSPGTAISRAMLVTILYRLSVWDDGNRPSVGLPSSHTHNPFTDVEPGAYYAAAVLWAVENGIAEGYGDGRFGTNENITRQDLAVIFKRYTKHIGAELIVTDEWIEFADESDVSDYAMDAIQLLHKLGIINGVGKNEAGQTFIDPKGRTTRGQAAALLHRFITLDYAKTWTLQEPAVTSVIGISSAEPDARQESYETVTIGGTNEVFYRLPLITGIGADNIESAFFMMKPINNYAVPDLRLAVVESAWVSYSLDEWWQEYFSIPSTWNDVNQYIGEYLESKQTITNDGWHSIDVTGLVKAWLNGTRDNFGFALSSDGKAEFYSIESEFCPKLVIRFRETDIQKHGKFGFEVQPPGQGNCMSYALRDRVMIGYYDLIDETALEKAYDEAGLEAALQYVKEQVISYVEKCKDDLKISSFREIDSFNAPINPETEYRIALRIGIGAERIIEGMLDFDYHFMLQLADGSWAEKLPGEFSRLVSGSHAGFDPGKYPWNKGFMWGKSIEHNGFYSSDVIYFAMQKSVDVFTDHKESGEM